jgi:fatty-acid desaturase
MVGVGGPLSYAMTHLVHHNARYTDTELDPHGYHRGIKSWLMCFQRTVNPDETPIFSKQIVKLHKRFWWMHEYYTPIVIVTALGLYLIDPMIFLFCWAIPSSLTLWAAAFVLLLQHDKHGPSNTRNYMWFGWGETWHKNHHDDPSLIDHSLGQGQDWTYQICKILSKSKKPL